MSQGKNGYTDGGGRTNPDGRGKHGKRGLSTTLPKAAEAAPEGANDAMICRVAVAAWRQSKPVEEIWGEELPGYDQQALSEAV